MGVILHENEPVNLMTAISNLAVNIQPSGNLRPFDAQRDLRTVADLVELCFADNLDPDGQRYLQQMRAAASDPSYLRWTRAFAKGTSLPLSGYVWEQDDKVVGNLTLIPFISPKYRYYLIANVAVHPDHRRRGIAGQMTTRALDYARLRGARAVWLHVRKDNVGAIAMYTHAGFSERARRTTWYYQHGHHDALDIDPDQLQEFSMPGARVRRRRTSEWAMQKQWLDMNYPRELRWHVSISPRSFRPSFSGFFSRLFKDIHVQHWSVYRDQQLLGVLTWQSAYNYADHLWLATDVDSGAGALTRLLQHACQHSALSRPLTLEFPAGKAAKAIHYAGFTERQTLIWMELKLK